MPEQDCLRYKRKKDIVKCNKNLEEILKIIAFKYNMTIKCNISGKEIKYPKIKEVKKMVCNKCNKYFNIKITIKQIDFLLRPHKGKFPYTSIVIIETIYNLLKEDKDRWGSAWKEECRDYLSINHRSEILYEQFLLGDLPSQICNKKDEYMNDSNYRELFRCYIDSRALFQKEFDGLSVKDCIERFLVEHLDEKCIPQIMYKYQSQRVYFK